MDLSRLYSFCLSNSHQPQWVSKTKSFFVYIHFQDLNVELHISKRAEFIHYEAPLLDLSYFPEHQRSEIIHRCLTLNAQNLLSFNLDKHNNHILITYKAMISEDFEINIETYMHIRDVVKEHIAHAQDIIYLLYKL